MRLVIELPDEFQQHFEVDRFQDSFMRINGDVSTREDRLSGRYEDELLTVLKEAFKGAKESPFALVGDDGFYLGDRT